MSADPDSSNGFPAGLLVLALLSSAGAVLALIISVFFFQYSRQESMVAVYFGFRSMNPFIVIGVIVLVFAGTCAINCYGLFTLRRWSRPLTIFLLLVVTLMIAEFIREDIGADLNRISSHPILVGSFLASLLIDFLTARYLFGGSTKCVWTVAKTRA